MRFQKKTKLNYRMKKLQQRLITLFFILLITTSTIAQVIVTGTVTDAKGETLPGVNLVIKGTDKGTVTDLNGKFGLNVPSINTIIVFSYLGYENQELKPQKPQNMQVVLTEESKLLSEVMVIGYGDVKRRDLTGSVSKVSMDDLIKAPVMSFDQALAGRVAGVNVSSSDGVPGATMNIVIRGNNSITQGNSPLYVIDGFPVDDPAIASTINPNDIESMDVLKDASATAIYGARGANGVIIITTKRGKIGVPKISYDGSFSMQTVTRLIPMMDAYNFVKLQEEILSPSDMVGTTGYYKTYEGKAYTLEDYRNVEQFNWQELILQDAPMQSHSISINGGTNDVRYNASLSYFDQDGILIKSKYNRVQGRMGMVLKKNKLTVSLSSNNSTTNQFGSIPSQTSFSGSINLFYSVWGYRPVTQPGTDINSLLDASNDPDVDQLNDYRFNPILSLKNEYRKNTITTNQYNGYIEYEFIKGLRLRASGGYTVQNRKGENFFNSNTRFGSPISIDLVNATLSTSDRKTWLNENTLSYQTNIKRVHSLNALLGMTMQASNFDNYSMKARAIPNESLGMAGMGQGTPIQINSGISDWSLMSYLARFNYNYKSKYYLTASIRADGSSKFGKENRYGYFPSTSLAWNFTEESFMKPLSPILSSGKLRLSWGQIGNNRSGDYDTYSQLQILQGSTGGINHGVFSFGNVVERGAVPFVLGNTKLKWETTSQTNAGLDLMLLKERISLTFDWYNKVTSDLLLLASLPLTSGYATAMKNIGKIQNQGVEITLNTTNIANKNFRWSTNFNISFNKNTVLELTENQISLLTNARFDQGFTGSNYIAKIGYPMGMMYGFQYLGTYKLDDFNSTNGIYSLKPGIARFTSENNTQPGMPRYADINNDGIIDSQDQTIIGRGDPIHIGGFTNNFEYKGFDLSVFFQWSYGNNILNANRLFFENGFKRRNLNMFASYQNRWSVDNPTSDIPAISNSSSLNMFNSRVIEDGSYLRLKTISIGYNLNQKTLKALKISKARLYLSAQNIFTLTKYSGYDPEVSVRNSALTPGLDYSSYPRASTVNVGINLGL